MYFLEYVNFFDWIAVLNTYYILMLALYLDHIIIYYPTPRQKKIDSNFKIYPKSTYKQKEGEQNFTKIALSRIFYVAYIWTERAHFMGLRTSYLPNFMKRF